MDVGPVSTTAASCGCYQRAHTTTPHALQPCKRLDCPPALLALLLSLALQQVGSPDLAATPQTLRAQLQKLQAQEEEAERLRAKLVGKVELLREEAAVLRSLDQEKRKLEEQVGHAGCFCMGADTNSEA